MSTAYSLDFDAEAKSFYLAGELSFATVNDVMTEANSLFEPIEALDIDLAKVTRSDSAGLALLIDWMRTAKSSNKKIVFHNIPAQMLAIATASGLDELIPLQ